MVFEEISDVVVLNRSSSGSRHSGSLVRESEKCQEISISCFWESQQQGTCSHLYRIINTTVCVIDCKYHYNEKY